MDEKPEFTGAIGDDPFADMEPDSLRDLGIEAELEAQPEEESPLDKSSTEGESAAASTLIPIEDEADMALARWLYLEGALSPGKESGASASNPASALNDQALLDWLLTEGEDSQDPDEET